MPGRRSSMKTCSLSDFMESITPWLSEDYIRKAHLNEKGFVVLYFLDGVQNVYNIDDCNADQIKDVLEDLKTRGIKVENST
jgi:hypothetical protein